MGSDRRMRLRAVIALAITVVITGAILTFIAFATHGDGFLEVIPEDATFTKDQTVMLTATLTAPAADDVNIDFENESGANDATPDLGATAPDATCDIAKGRSSCTVDYEASELGSDTWRVWVDEDDTDTTDDSDPDEESGGDQDRGPTAQAQSGLGDDCSDPTDPSPPLLEPDCTDVVKITVVDDGAAAQAKVDCDDSGTDADKERETNPSGGTASSETYQCTIFNSADAVTPGTVYGEVETRINDPDASDGASHDSPDYACGAGSTGKCSIVVTQNEGEDGTADICFWIPTDDGEVLCDDEPLDEGKLSDGSDAPNDPADRVEKKWVAPSSGSATASGSATGTATPSGTSTSAKPTSTKSPSGSGAPGRADRSITLTSSDDQVRSGRSVTLSGSVTSSDSDCRSGETVILKRRIHGTTTDEEVTRVTSDNAGSFSALVVVRKNADYLAEVELTGDCEFAASNSVTVEANAKVRDIGVNDKTPKRGRKVVVTGQIVPQQDGTRAVLKRKRGVRWVKVDTDILNDRSRANFVFKASWTGKRLFRIYWFPQNESNERARSKAFRISAHR